MAKAKKAPPKKATNSALVIVKGEKPLSKNQQAFNRLTTRIEKLQKEVEKKQKQFDEALNFYSKEVVPMDEQLAQQRLALLRLLFPFYRNRQLPANQRPWLKDMLQDFLQNVLHVLPGEPSAELKAFFQELEGERYDTVLKREEKKMKKSMADFFKGWGVNVDAADMDMSEEAFAEKMAEAQQQMQENQEREQRQWEERRKTRPKTAKQIEKEKAQAAAEELKQKSISTIYRQLAKLLHPDLEQDENRKAEKHQLMQEVTTAYEAKDLHRLLLLELRWIHLEQNHLETVADEKLALYLEILREQARSLETEKWQLVNHPRYQALLSRYGYRITAYPLNVVKNELAELSELREVSQMDIEQLQSPKALSYVKSMVKQWKQEREMDDADDLLSLLMQVRSR